MIRLLQISRRSPEASSALATPRMKAEEHGKQYWPTQLAVATRGGT